MNRSNGTVIKVSVQNILGEQNFTHIAQNRCQANNSINVGQVEVICHNMTFLELKINMTADINGSLITVFNTGWEKVFSVNITGKEIMINTLCLPPQFSSPTEPHLILSLLSQESLAQRD